MLRQMQQNVAVSINMQVPTRCRAAVYLLTLHTSHSHRNSIVLLFIIGFCFTLNFLISVCILTHNNT